MDLTPTAVENKEFTESRRGYAREEVDRFLDEVAAQFRRYEERLTQMTQRVAALESELGQSRETEEMTRRMMLVAQRASDEVVAEAEEKARTLVEESQRKAASLDEETRRRRSALEADIEALRRFEGEFRGQLRQIVEGHLALLQRTGRASAEPPGGPAVPQGAAPAVPAAPSGPPAPPPATQPSAPPARPSSGGPAPSGPGPAAAPTAPARPGPPPVRVADNDVLRRLAEGGRPEGGQR